MALETIEPAYAGDGHMSDRPLRTLIVDDEDSTRVGLAYYLESLDVPVEVVGEAPSGESAILRAPDLRPDLVIMDARLRGISGFAATRAIMQESPSTAVVVFSLYDDEFGRNDARASGAIAFVAKTDLGALARLVSELHSQLAA